VRRISTSRLGQNGVEDGVPLASLGEAYGTDSHEQCVVVPIRNCAGVWSGDFRQVPLLDGKYH
jgi:hypothetical protein